MITNVELQQAFITKLKAMTALIAKIVAEEVREDQWQGTEFVYPCVRVRLISNVPGDDGCGNVYSIGLQAFSENASSQEADEIAGIIGTNLHLSAFAVSGLNVNVQVTNLIPAIRRDVRTWRAEVLVQGTVSK